MKSIISKSSSGSGSSGTDTVSTTASWSEVTSTTSTSTTLSRIEMEDLRDAFQLLDVNESGSVTAPELRSVLSDLVDELANGQQRERIGVVQTLSRIVGVMDSIPNDKSLTLDDFVALLITPHLPKAKQQASIGRSPSNSSSKRSSPMMMTRNHSALEDEYLTNPDVEDDDVTVADDEMKRVFDLFDHGSKGYIEVRDLARVATELGESMDEQELEEMIQRAAPNKDGRVTIKEFTGIMNKTLCRSI